MLRSDTSADGNGTATKEAAPTNANGDILARLDKLSERLEEVTKKNSDAEAEHKKYREAVSFMFRPDAPFERRAEAYRTLLKAEGHPDDVIEKYIDQQRSNLEPAPKGKRGRKKPAEDVEEEEEVDDPVASRLEEMEEELKNQRESNRKQNLSKLEKALSEAVSSALDSHPDAKAYFAKEGNDKKRTFWHESLRRQVVDQLVAAKNKGETITEESFKPMVDKVKGEVLDHLSEIGRANAIGRTPGTATDFEEIIKGKPKEMPKYDSKVGISPIEQSMQEATSDKLLRAVATVPTGESKI